MPRSPLNPVEGQGVKRLRLEFRLMRKPLVPLSGRTLQPKDLTRVLHRPVELAVVIATYPEAIQFRAEQGPHTTAPWRVGLKEILRNDERSSLHQETGRVP